ncbi:hypothetical protein Pcinc_035862 [Petrolisthes cinctipes]|uniref:WD repeat-containing protein 74 n=1 Tax=Petrolisthes cinctipes TaxID=88211 RepID=A0AAE1BWU1_PETCI|nr:hypothetical protein Pcinc_035862 [Petrolisthes cinctipes]
MLSDSKLRDFNVFIGAETGILKGVNLNEQYVITKNFHNVKALDREQEITAIAWGDEEETEVLMGLRNQTIKIFDTDVKAFVSSRKISTGSGPIVSIGRVDGVTLTAVKSGQITLWRQSGKVEINALGRGEFLSRMRQDPYSQNIVATGGKESDLRLWDLNRPAVPTFRAKNVKRDMLDIRVPVWVSDIAFLNDLRCIAVTTRHRHIRLYDIRQQRKPTLSFEYGNHANTAISTTNTCGSHVFVGTSIGRMGLFDFRGKNPKMPLRSFKGFAGAVRDIVVNASEPYVFSVSLDRFLRAHHIYTGELLYKEYMKSRLNCLVARKKTDIRSTLPTTRQKIRHTDGWEIEEREEEEEEEEEEEVEAEEEMCDIQESESLDRIRPVTNSLLR